MRRGNEYASWGIMAGIIGIGLGVVAGILGLLDPISIYAPGPQPYNFASQSGRTVAILLGLMLLCFTAAFLSYHLIGAAGDGLLGKTATVLSALGNLGVALSFFHAALIGASSPLFWLGFLSLPGWALLTVAALREKRVSVLSALWPLGTLIALSVIELGLGTGGLWPVVHHALYGSISFVVWFNLNKARVSRPISLTTA